MYCSSCGKKINDNAAFCSFCGNKVVVEQKQQTDDMKSIFTGFGETVKKTFTDAISTTADSYEERQNVYEGRIHKCPNCGNQIKSFESVCELCGFEFRDTYASASIIEFQRQLKEIEKNRVERNGFKSMLNMRTATDDQIINHILSFPIPNDKEAVLEFMQLAAPNATNTDGAVGVYTDIANAWKSKFNQAYAKAKIILKDDKDNLELAKALKKQITGEDSKRRVKNILLIVMPFIVLIGIAVVAGLIGTNSEKKKIESENERLEKIVNEIYIEIENENYDIALLKAQSLYFDESISSKKSEEWNKQKQDIVEFIQNKKNE